MIYFLIYLFIEVMVSSYFAGILGGLNTFLEILISALIGIYILSSFKHSLSDNIEKIKSGQISQDQFIKTNAGKSIGALLLIIPGFFTDIVGILLQFGLFIALIGKIFTTKQYEHKFQNNKFSQEKTNINNTYYKKEINDEIIDVEIIDDHSTTKQ